MSKEDLDLDDDFIAEDAEEIEEESPAVVAKTALAKRRMIDNLLAERRLQKQMADYDFDLDWAPNNESPQDSLSCIDILPDLKDGDSYC